MLKSTHRPASGISSSSLLEGWTEHKAPSGHTYYYNAATKVSTYTRPQDFVTAPEPDTRLATSQPHRRQTDTNALQHINGHARHPGFSNKEHQDSPASGANRSSVAPRFQHRDRPKSKAAIPGSEPWVLVTTRLARRFVHNPETKASFWRFPPDVLRNVIELDRENREKRQKTEHVSNHQEAALPAPTVALPPVAIPTPVAEPELASDEEYEEVEVTDDEGEGIKLNDAGGDPQTDQPVDFDEDDIAYQLQAMGQDYGLDPEEYGDEDIVNAEEGTEGLPLTDDDAKALFKDLLDDLQVSPFATWDALIDAGHIIEDDRYVALTNMRSRKEVWGEWSKDKTQQLKDQRALEAKKDPRIPYFEFLEARATPKLYWPEFRRKYQKEPEMRNTKLLDKDREKWYREHISRLKLPEYTLKADFVTLLKSLPLYALNRSTTLESLPPAMVTDSRFISLRPAIRNPLIDAHTRTLDPAPVNPELSAEEAQQLAKDKAERERRETALIERQKLVDQDRKRQEGALRYGKGMLREGEEQVQRARQVNKQGLLGHLESDQDTQG